MVVFFMIMLLLLLARHPDPRKALTCNKFTNLPAKPVQNRLSELFDIEANNNLQFNVSIADILFYLFYL